MKKDVTALLPLLKQENDRENAKRSLAQRVHPAEKAVARIPTLDGKTRPMSPMLRARFAFAGRWENAVLGQTWLSTTEMGRALTTRDYKQEIALRRENWISSPVAKLSLDRLALFAADVDDQDATYLVWEAARESDAEPKVIQFVGGSESTYKDLAAYLKSHVGEAALLSGATTSSEDAPSLAAYLTDERRRLDAWVGGLDRWGQSVVARAAIAIARLVLPKIPAAMRKKSVEVLDIARAWAEAPTGELPASFSYVLAGARPISPDIEGKTVFEAMHACVAAAGCASGYHMERKSVIYEDAVKTALLGMRKTKPADVARALNAAGFNTPAGAKWKPETTKKALARLEETLGAARSNASTTVEHVLAVLGKSSEAKLRAAVRKALR